MVPATLWLHVGQYWWHWKSSGVEAEVAVAEEHFEGERWRRPKLLELLLLLLLVVEKYLLESKAEKGNRIQSKFIVSD